MTGDIWARADLRTAHEAFRAAVSACPDGACVAVPSRPGRDYYPAGAEWTYREVAEQVDALAARYAAAGFGHGHRVGLLLDNRPEIVPHMLALNSLGVTVLPLNPDYRETDLRYILDHAQLDMVVALAARIAVLEGAVAGMREPCAIAREEEGRFPGARRRADKASPDRESVAAILYTSGTTGLPKGCVIPNAYFFSAAERYLTAGGAMTVRFAGERLFNPLPLFYANSFAISNMAMIMSANCMIFPDRFHARTWWRDLCETKATIIHYLGLIPPVVLSAATDPDERRHSVRFGVGAGVDPRQQAVFAERFGFPLVEVWGMSEVGIATAACTGGPAPAARSIGCPLRGIELRLVDDSDEEVAPGAEGELCVRRQGEEPKRGLFREYFRDPAATAEAWRGGWFHTGDIVRREADGSYTFVDRKKHMIRRSGQNIAAAEIEACLSAHGAIAGVACIAVPDSLREEEVMACVVLAEGRDKSGDQARDIVEWALARIAYFKVPGWILFLDELPITPTQKLQKSAIAAHGQDITQSPDCFDLRSMKQAGRA